MSKIKKKPVLLLFFFLGIFALGASAAFFSRTYYTEDYHFSKFADKLFQQEVQGNTLNLHYTLAEPGTYNIHNYPRTLGRISMDTFEENASYCTKQLQKLASFAYEDLSLKNQLLYDTISHYLTQESTESQFPLMYEPLSPTLGIQAQLPILLAEYTFRSKTDIDDYLMLIEDIYPYFQQIINYENDKAAAGLFMNEDTVSGIIDQCQDFLSDKEHHYLITTFQERLTTCDFLSDKKKEAYIEENKRLLETSCYPAYELLIHSLQSLRSDGTNSKGLCYLPEGKAYYEHLVKSTTGICDPIKTIESRLYDQFHEDYMQIQRLCTAFPNIAEEAQQYSRTLADFSSPDAIITDLQKQMQYAFPAIPSVDYEIKYVNDSLKEHLSPAFYLTPPIDTRTPNSVYLNPDSDLTGVTLYTTLAHESFPGHLYQTQYFAQTEPHPLLSLLASGGYVEGWATYIETYAYSYAPIPYEISQYLMRNRSFQLCLYSILDINIHYHGWDLQQVGRLLSALGIQDEGTWKTIYQCLLEDPANYLKYCAGSLYLQDLRDDISKIQANDFDIQEFHKKILEIGPVPFPVLTKYLYLTS